MAAAPHIQPFPNRDQTQEQENEQSVLNVCDFEPLGKNDQGLSISSLCFVICDWSCKGLSQVKRFDSM